MKTAIPPFSKSASTGIMVILALVMVVTRINHFGAVPDASWAVFFIAGFYLSAASGSVVARSSMLERVRSSLRWRFALLVVLAVLIDFIVITSQGIDFWSHYCMSPAYFFLLPSYAVLWLGGAWLRTRYSGLSLRAAGALVLATTVTTSLCFAVSNGSFYWLSANVPLRSFAGWMQNLGDWYLPYLRTVSMYVAIAAMLHVAASLAARALGAGASGHAIR